jgi:molecular chaperone GrpE
MKKDDETPAAAAGANESPNAAPEGAQPVEAQGAEAGAGGAEFAALQDRFLRLAAEFDNYRKRTERERAEAWTRAQAQLVEKLLEPLDDLHRVADVKPEATSTTALLEGVQMVERKLFRTLEAAGLEPIDAEGHPFDPSVHEALMTAEAEDEAQDNSIGMVFQAGYRFKGQLLRPARVQVKKFGG